MRGFTPVSGAVVSVLRGGSWIDLPPVNPKDGLKETHNEFWSENTKRSTTGKLNGTLIATKTGLELKWGALNASEIKTIANAIYGVAFTKIRYPSALNGGAIREIEVYFADPTYTPLILDGKVMLYQNVVLSIVER